MSRALVVAALVACTPAPSPSSSAPSSPSASSSSSLASSSARAPAAIAVDVRLELEEGPDPDFGQGETSVRAVLDIPKLGVRRKLFAVPFPYHCGRGASDSGVDLVVQCMGDDGMATAAIRTEARRVVVVARDYGRLDANKTESEIALPEGATATLFAPSKFPR